MGVLSGGKCSGVGEGDSAYLGVRKCSVRGGLWGEHFGFGKQLCVYFKPDDGFVGVLCSMFLYHTRLGFFVIL